MTVKDSPEALAEPAPEAAQEPGDTSWSTAFGASDVGSTPYAAAVDGDVVYLGGDFTGVMAGMPQDTYLRIARWDGVAWSRMGDGLDGTVRTIAVVGGGVVVGGEFSVAGKTVAAARLARWDGQAWSALGGGVSYSDLPSMAVVRAVATDGKRVFVTGTFDKVGHGADAVEAAGIAAFDLETERWSALGAGLTHLGSAGEGRALVVVDNRLYVGGYFDAANGAATASLACVDVTTGDWTTFGAGIRDGDFAAQVESLAWDAGSQSLYVGGSFTLADTVPASGVVRLQETSFTAPGEFSFTALGEFTYFGQASTASVKALAVSGDRVYAGGEFTTAGNSAAANWVVLDPAAPGEADWSAPWNPIDNVVRVLTPYRDGVVAGGDFTRSGTLRITHAGIWTGADWQTFGQGVSYDPYADGNVYAVVADSDGVFVAGYFDQAGPVPVGSVARWTGTAWDALGGGLAGVNGLAKVCAMARLGDHLYVTGEFASAGGVATANIARWDGTAWSAVGSGLNATGYALAVLGGNLYVGGSFTAAGATPASGVAKWDPATSTWSALGNAPIYDDDVLGLAAVADRFLVIGGEYNAFRREGRDLVRGLNGMVAFDTQATIDPADETSGYLVVAGVKRSSGTGTVRALQLLGDTLYVGGSFDTAGVIELADPQQTGFAAQNLAVWKALGDGSWSSGGGADQPVQAFVTRADGRLVLAGWFTVAGTTRANGVAEFDPATSTWAAYGSGLGGGLRGIARGEALALTPQGLWVGGTFDTAGGVPGCSIAFRAEPVPAPPPAEPEVATGTGAAQSMVELVPLRSVL